MGHDHTAGGSDGARPFTAVITRHARLLEAGRQLAARAAVYGGCPQPVAGRLADAVDRAITAIAGQAREDADVELRFECPPGVVRVSVRCADASAVTAAMTAEERGRLGTLVDEVDVVREGASGICRLSCHVPAS